MSVIDNKIVTIIDASVKFEVLEMGLPIEYYNAGFWDMKTAEFDKIERQHTEIGTGQQISGDEVRRTEENKLDIETLSKHTKKELIQRLEKLRTQIDAKGSQIAHLERKIKIFEKDEEEKSIVAEKKSLREVNEKKMKLVTELEYSKQRPSEETIELTKERANVYSNMREVNKKNAQNNNLRTKLNSIEILLKEKTFEVNKTIRERDTVQQECKEIIQSNKIEAEGFEQKFVSVESKMKEEISTMKNTLKEGDAAFLQSVKSSHNLQRKMEEMHKQLEFSKKALEKKSEEFDKKSKECIGLKKKATISFTSQHDRICDLDKQIFSVQSMLQKSPSQIESMSREREIAKRECEELKISNLALQQKIDDLKSIQEKGKILFAEIDDQAKIDYTSIEKMKKELQYKDNELDASKKKIKLLEDQLLHNNSIRQNSDFFYRSEIEKLKRKVQSTVALTEENADLRGKIERLQFLIDGKVDDDSWDEMRESYKRTKEVESTKAKINATTKFLTFLYKIILK